jgi:endonuclease/exonuclease/phosphatase family metal-dependent hydrolase
MFNLRVATFNCENLFSRPRIFEQPPKKSQQLLALVAQLEQELQKDVFDHQRISDLEAQLSGFATINDVRGKLNTAHGAKDFLGWVELTRDENHDAAVENTARVIAEIDADIICLIEVESRLELQKFHDQLLFPQFLKAKGKAGYKYVLLIDGNDDRGIDVGFLSRLPVLGLRSHIEERTQYLGQDVTTFSRDCLEVDIALPDARRLHLLINHLKSKAFSPTGQDPQSNLRREGQARRVAELAAAFDLANDLVIVAGDLNDTPDSAALAHLLSTPGLFNVVERLAANDRFTFRTGGEQIDYLLVSDPLKAALQEVHIERRGISAAHIPHFPTVTNRRTEASDHGAVVANFQL